MNEIYKILILIKNIGQYSKFSHIKMSDCQKDNVPTLKHSQIQLDLSLWTDAQFDHIHRQVRDAIHADVMPPTV
jgi:hypothetical protein